MIALDRIPVTETGEANPTGLFMTTAYVSGLFIEDGFGSRLACFGSMAQALEFAIDGYWGGH